jgi:hypothetical protein
MRVKAVLGHILKSETLMAAVEGHSAALHFAVAIPKGKDQDWSINDRILRRGTQNMLQMKHEMD